MVDGVVAHHLEVLRLVLRRRVGVRLVEGVGHADALDRALLDAVHDLGGADAGRLQDRRHDVDHMVELVADAALVRDHLRPGNRHALAHAAEVRGDLLGPGERRVERPGPRHRHVRVGLVRAPDIVEVLELVLDRHHDAVEHRHLVRRAVQRALGAGAVVAVDVDDQRVVELAHVLDRLDHAADLVVGVGHVRGEDVDLPEEHLLLVGRERVPLLQQVVRPGRQLGVRRDHAELLLVGEDLLAQLVPALVEQVHVADLLDPLRRRMMRRVRAAGDVVDEERLLRRQRVDPVHVGDRLVGHRGGEVIRRVADEGIDVRRVADEVRRLPLIGVAAHEAVEVLEAHADRPLVERAVRACLEGRRVVVLAEPRRPVAVVLQDPADRRLVLGDDAVVARVARRLLRRPRRSPTE